MMRYLVVFLMVILSACSSNDVDPELEAAVIDANELLASLQAKADSVVLIQGPKGDTGDQGAVGDKGANGDPGSAVTVQQVLDLKAEVLAMDYIVPIISLADHQAAIDPSLISAQDKLQNILDVIERIEVGNSIDTQ